MNLVLALLGNSERKHLSILLDEHLVEGYLDDIAVGDFFLVATAICWDFKEGIQTWTLMVYLIQKSDGYI